MNLKQLKVGILIGQKMPNLNVDDFDNMEQLRKYVNYNLSINITPDMSWSRVLKEVKSNET